MIEIKVSQGAKPGHGGILPAAKVTAEIAEARLVPAGQGRVLAHLPQGLLDPAGDDARSSPSCASSVERQAGRVQALRRRPARVHGDRQGDDPDRHLRRLHRRRRRRGRHGCRAAGVLRLPRRAAQRGPARSSRTPSSAPASATGSRSAPAARWSPRRRWPGRWRSGADWCNSARAFMFAVGCIQSQRCHTNQCPVGVTTQDPKLQRALIVPDKAERVHNYHRNTVHALAEMIAAMGLDHTERAAARTTSSAGSASSRRWRSTRSTTSCNPGAFLDGTATRTVPGVLGPGLRRVLPPLVCLRAGRHAERPSTELSGTS